MEAPPLERKLVAILAADVASYSRLMEIDEEGTLATLSAFRLVTDRLITQHEGRICGTAGDSILAAFGSALAAVQCAVEIQNELAHANNDLEKDRRMQFRIGINLGDVMLKDGDIFGDGVNIAARLEGLADPGGICISRGIHDRRLGCEVAVIQRLAVSLTQRLLTRDPLSQRVHHGKAETLWLALGAIVGRIAR